jgi:hypothetical protein
VNLVAATDEGDDAAIVMCRSAMRASLSLLVVIVEASCVFSAALSQSKRSAATFVVEDNLM